MAKHKKLKRTSITFRIGLSLSLLIIFLMSSVSLANYYRTKQSLETQVLDKGWSIVKTGASFTKEYLYSGSPAPPEEFLSNIKSVPNVNYAVVIGTNGMVIAHTNPQLNGERTGITLPDKPFSQKYTDNEKKPGIEFVYPVIAQGGQTLGYFALGMNTAEDEAILQNILINMIAITVSAVIAGIFLAMVLTRRILNSPIKDLLQATEHISAGDFAHQVKVHNLDELGSLATAFNTMTGHLGNLFRSVQTSAAEITKSSQLIIRRSEDFKLSLKEKVSGEGDMETATIYAGNFKQAEALKEITTTARKMARLVDRLNSLSLQFKV